MRAFTYADFAACDHTLADHFAAVPWDVAARSGAPVPELLGGRAATDERVPILQMVDEDGVLREVVVDGPMMLEVQACAEAWHSLQELGGIHNSHAARELARARSAQAAAAGAPAVTGEVVASENAPSPEIVAEDAAGAAPGPEGAYIETPRCTTCNECTNLNDRMFAYDSNKQAYIANLDAGSYAELVQAAESCQIAIIHPGKPRNPEEAGLAELIERAQPFQ